MPQFGAAVDFDALLEAPVTGLTLAVERSLYLNTGLHADAADGDASRLRLLLHLARQGLVGHVPHALVSLDGSPAVSDATMTARWRPCSARPGCRTVWRRTAPVPAGRSTSAGPPPSRRRACRC
ncbi:hypothetical protein A6302_03221 [Methylobrevis pamukkalensis]|uniref:Uncharacterized protein n=1 Tax=Methylobrevis pamukkalensis TaxID=1439726 RepID=A0A1E3GZJ4_9HYPH|nr:hypothetical protein A6302_03221 [Methylobrevis pamukkalensis]